MSNIIVMAFSPRNVVACLLKKGLQMGGGGGSRAPQDPPRYALGVLIIISLLSSLIDLSDNEIEID